jgi:hypothetical protein
MRFVVDERKQPADGFEVNVPFSTGTDLGAPHQ